MIQKIVLAILFALSLNANQTITVAGPSAGVSHPLFHMIQENSLKDMDKTLSLTSVSNNSSKFSSISTLRLTSESCVK